jgi:hypothetical protein
MKCPICEAWCLVKDTRKRSEENATVRRYECANYHTFKTTEHITLIMDEKTKERLKKTRLANLARWRKSLEIHKQGGKK